jgi:hypothetical protein
MPHKGEDKFGGDRTGRSLITEDIPLPKRKPKSKKKKKSKTNKRGGGMVGSSNATEAAKKVIQGYKKGGQV